MSDKSTKRMIKAYNQQAEPTLFLTGQFQAPAKNFYNSEKVEIDITRSGEDIAIVITDLSTGRRVDSTDIYTNKEFLAPVYSQEIALNSFDLLKRMPGSDPFADFSFRANIIKRMIDGMKLEDAKIRRSIELQASQILQTGKLILTDENGVALYQIDFKPKSTHFPTAGTTWGQVGADPYGDLNSLGEVVRTNGLMDPDLLEFGIDAFIEFQKDAEIRALLDNRRTNAGEIQRLQLRGNGGTFRGTIDIGNYKYDMWTYGGRYTDPQTGNAVPYIDPGKVIMRASAGRLDATFGNIPNINKMFNEAPLIPELPRRFSNRAGIMDMILNIWKNAAGTQLHGSVSARPLLIPTAIDRFGCLDTGL